MLLVFPVRACDVIAARSDQLFHERIEGSHLCGRVRQLIRHDGDNGRPFEVSADPFYSESNINHLRQIVHDIDTGKAKLTEHDLIEVD